LREKMIKAIQKQKEMAKFSTEQIETMVDRMIKDNHVIMEKTGFAFYVKCDNELLAKIQAHKEYLIYPDLVEKLLCSTGRHIHFIGVYSTTPESDAFQAILRGIEHILKKENPKSISWYNRTMDKFIIRRILCQHRQ